MLMVIGCKSEKKIDVKPKVIANQTVRANGYVLHTSIVNNNIEVPGTLLSYETTEIHPEVAGKIIQLNIRDGQNISKGAMMVKLFDGDLQAQLRKIRVQLQIAQKTEERAVELLNINAISRQEYDLNLLNVSNLRADIQIIQANIAKTIIRAPFSGKVGFRNVAPGSYVTPATVICNLSVVNKLKLEFSLPEKYNSMVSTGQYVSFGVEGSPKKYTAQIIATEASVSEATRSLKVRAIVELADKFISPGSFAKVRFDMGEDHTAIMVPTQAIIPQARDKKIVIYRNGVANFQTVTTGIRDSTMVQILSGVAVGDTIITDGLLAIKPNSKVQLASVKKD